MPGHRYVILLALVLTLTSCRQQADRREYEEIVITPSLKSRVGAHGDDPHAFMKDAPLMSLRQSDASRGMALSAGQDHQTMQKVLDASVARPPLSWETPRGWTEEKGGSMRLVTFRAQDEGGGMECSIISLSGQAGGLQPNVVRWMKQINAVVPPADQLDDFLSRQEVIKTKGGFSVTVVDLTELPPAGPGDRETVQIPGEGQAPSMIAAVAELQDMTVFVKMTGTKEAVLRNRDPFMSLCRSLTLNNV